MMNRETDQEYRERMKRFENAKAAFDFYDTGLGRLLPNRDEERQKANRAMWDDANGPELDEDEEDEYESEEECPTCEGTGYDPDHEHDPDDELGGDDTCQDCGGDGVIRF